MISFLVVVVEIVKMETKFFSTNFVETGIVGCTENKPERQIRLVYYKKDFLFFFVILLKKFSIKLQKSIANVIDFISFSFFMKN